MSKSSRMTGSRSMALSTTSTFLVAMFTTPGVTARTMGATDNFSAGGMVPATVVPVATDTAIAVAINVFACIDQIPASFKRSCDGQADVLHVRPSNFSAAPAGLACGPVPACRSGEGSDSSARLTAPVASTMNVAASAQVSLYASCCFPIMDLARQPRSNAESGKSSTQHHGIHTRCKAQSRQPMAHTG